MAIEEQAKEAAKKEFGDKVRPSVGGPWMLGYAKGANDIIEKACKWLQDNNGKRINGFDNVYTIWFIEHFRKAMEE